MNDTTSSHFAQMAQTEPVRLGPYSSYALKDDPRHLLFTLARYKFCAKMLAGRGLVLEVGCGESLGVELLLQGCRGVHGLDISSGIIEYNRKNNRHPDRLTFQCFDLASRPLETRYEAAFSLDVIEHLAPEREAAFLSNLSSSLQDQAPCIIGTPNISASSHASEVNRREHINLKSHVTLLESLTPYFHNVFLFSMNDELIHTGFYPMAHYLMALAVGPRR